MVAYSFQKRFAQPILAGTKLHTIRALRSRHARPGEELQLYCGMRTNQCRLIARKTCSAALAIGVDLHRSQILIEGGAYPWAGKKLAIWKFDELTLAGTCLTHGDLFGFAQRDGFDGWPQMREFWIKTHGVPRENGIFVGKLIGWWQ